MAKPIGKRPENFWKTLRTLLHYMGNHRFLLLAVAVCLCLIRKIDRDELLKAMVRTYLGE